jgi:hypothetical protein
VDCCDAVPCFPDKWDCRSEVRSLLGVARRMGHGRLKVEVDGLLEREVVHCRQIEAVRTRLEVHGVGHAGGSEHGHVELDLVCLIWSCGGSCRGGNHGGHAHWGDVHDLTGSSLLLLMLLLLLLLLMLLLLLLLLLPKASVLRSYHSGHLARLKKERVGEDVEAMFRYLLRPEDCDL